jgi:hypothetical protein
MLFKLFEMNVENIFFFSFNILAHSSEGKYKYNTKRSVDNSVCALCFLIVNKEIPFFSGLHFGPKNWLVNVFLIIIVFSIGAVFIILIIVIGEKNTILTTSGTVLSARKEYAGSFCV